MPFALRLPPYGGGRGGEAVSYFLLIRILFHTSIMAVMAVRMAAPIHVKTYFMQA